MTWTISVSNESWDEIYECVHKQPYETLLNAVLWDDYEKTAETVEKYEQLFDELHDENDYAMTHEQLHNLQMKRWARTEAYLQKWVDQEALADEVFDRIVDHQSCSNGGWEIYLDRGGNVTMSW